MHVLVDELAGQIIVERGISIQAQSNVGVDHTKEGRGVGAMTSFHVAVIF